MLADRKTLWSTMLQKTKVNAINHVKHIAVQLCKIAVPFNIHYYVCAACFPKNCDVAVYMHCVSTVISQLAFKQDLCYSYKEFM